MFCMLMRKHLLGARVHPAWSSFSGDRILAVALRRVWMK